MVVVVILTQVFDIVPITYAIGALAVMFTLKKIFDGKDGGKGNKDAFKEKVEQLRNEEDIKVESSAELRQTVQEVRLIENEAKKSSDKKRIITTGKQKLTLDLKWSESLGDLLEATDIVYSNADMVGKNLMNESRFRYYCGLHFRSHMADQLCREKIDVINQECNKINNLLDMLNDRNNPLRLPKNEYNQVITIKKAMIMSLKLLKDRSKRLSIQTGNIRDKIGQECGKRGYEWWLKRKENAQHAKEERMRY